MNLLRFGLYVMLSIGICACTFELISGSQRAWNESTNRGWYFELTLTKEPVIVPLNAMEIPKNYSHLNRQFWIRMDVNLESIYVSRRDWSNLKIRVFTSPDSIYYHYKKGNEIQAFYPVHWADTQAIKLELGKIQVDRGTLFMTGVKRKSNISRDSLFLFGDVLLRPNDLMLRDLVMLPKLD